MTTNKELTVGLVGVCAAGKSTLAAKLKARGYQVKHIAQEHSFVKDMWRRIANPDVLVFLDASFETTLQRRNLNWNQADYDEQHRRLAHAREKADFTLHTDDLTPEEVEAKVVAFLDMYHRL